MDIVGDHNYLIKICQVVAIKTLKTNRRIVDNMCENKKQIDNNNNKHAVTRNDDNDNSRRDDRLPFEIMCKILMMVRVHYLKGVVILWRRKYLQIIWIFFTQQQKKHTHTQTHTSSIQSKWKHLCWIEIKAPLFLRLQHSHHSKCEKKHTKFNWQFEYKMHKSLLPQRIEGQL